MPSARRWTTSTPRTHPPGGAVALTAVLGGPPVHHIPVLDHEHRFAGMVTQSDVIAALYQSRLSEPLAA